MLPNPPAVAAASTALDLAIKGRNAEQAAQIERRLALYRERRPYVEVLR